MHRLQNRLVQALRLDCELQDWKNCFFPDLWLNLAGEIFCQVVDWIVLQIDTTRATGHAGLLVQHVRQIVDELLNAELFDAICDAVLTLVDFA